MNKARWEHFPHGADIGIRGIGKTLEEAFEQAGIALTAVLTEPEGVLPKDPVDIRCEESDDEICFVDWLNALVYEMATRGMLFGKFDLLRRGTLLECKAWGEKVDVKRHRPAVEVKGATYTALSVRKDKTGIWTAQCVVDV